MNVFDTLYSTGGWGNSSGPGSHPDKTVEYREMLQKEINLVKSVWDLGCGDWQFSKYLYWDTVMYLGTDVSKIAIQQCMPFADGKRLFASVSDEIVCGHVADLCIIKDVLQHLSNRSIMRILGSVRNCGTLLVTNDVCTENTDCEDGGYRPVDLRMAPFGLEAEEVLRFQSEPFQKVTLKIRLKKS